jgi:hypothetical protein
MLRSHVCLCVPSGCLPSHFEAVVFCACLIASVLAVRVCLPSHVLFLGLVTLVTSGEVYKLCTFHQSPVPSSHQAFSKGSLVCEVSSDGE